MILQKYYHLYLILQSFDQVGIQCVDWAACMESLEGFYPSAGSTTVSQGANILDSIWELNVEIVDRMARSWHIRQSCRYVISITLQRSQCRRVTYRPHVVLPEGLRGGSDSCKVSRSKKYLEGDSWALFRESVENPKLPLQYSSRFHGVYHHQPQRCQGCL